MSQFFSRQYLRARQQAAEARPIGADLGCSRCGYNLRGLMTGASCPECGAVIALGVADDDVLLGCSPATRHAWRLGLGAMFLCLVIFTAARVLKLFVAFGGVAGAVRVPYAIGLLALSVVWTAACWAVTPIEIGKRFIILGHLRHVVRLTQLLWPLGLAAWLVGMTGKSNSMVQTGHVLWFIAAAGVVVLVTILCRLALWAELDEAAVRLHAVGWLLPIATLVAQVLPSELPWFGLVLQGLLLGLWAWVMVVFALAVLRLQRHVTWGIAERRDLPLRAGRIAEARRRLTREVEARVRPVSPDLEDLPMDPPPATS